MNSTTHPHPRRNGPSYLTHKALALLAFLSIQASTVAATLPTALTPGAPFPPVTAASVEREPVAPGIARATYRLLTAAGPLVISVLTVDPHEPTVRFGAVLGHDKIVSKGEPASSMARRTGAVAGINGDYFDINGTGAPVGVLVRNGTLDRTPNPRIALTVSRDRTIRFETYRFAGTVTTGAVSVPLTGVNEWPPRNGATLLTPSFGVPPPAANIALLDLEPLPATADVPQRYRIAAVTPAPPWPVTTGPRLGFGPSAQGFGPLPDVGDVVALAFDTDPPLAGVVAAIGGGPELLHDGTTVDDPASPNYADRDKRIPASAAARFADGTIALVVVDGRHPATSIGVNRAELIALLRALGATDAMLLDSGGSATLVARVLGDADASVVNEPSDGVERPVADGLFVYSDAPLGPPSRLVVRPSRIVALPGARIALRARLVDANGHGLGDARGAWHIAPTSLVAAIGEDDVLRAGDRPGVADVRIARGGVAGDLPIAVVDRVARLVVGPPRANPDPHTAQILIAQAFDAHDRPVAMDGVVRWSAKDGAIDQHGRLVAGDRDAVVTASAGGATATVTIPVGRRTVPVALFDDKHHAAWRLVTTPANGPGSVSVDGDKLALAYDFTSGERAAYALQEIPLGEPLALSCAVDGDANGEALRATFVDRFGDREIVTFARTIDFTGTRRLNVKVPVSLAPPIALRNLYVVGSPSVTPAAGTVTLRDCNVTLPGAQAP